MKKITTSLIFIVLILFCGCNHTEINDESLQSETTIETTTYPQKRINFINTDFRNIRWGMNSSEIEQQEERYADNIYGDCIVFNNIEYSGFNTRLYYYIDDDNKCRSAEYQIILDDENEYDYAYTRITRYLDNLYCVENENGTRETKSANISITDKFNNNNTQHIICIKFTKPENYPDETTTYTKVIYY